MTLDGKAEEWEKEEMVVGGGVGGERVLLAPDPDPKLSGLKGTPGPTSG